tara:strand:+ start:118289 stop:119812 length:1524 start_codon:yes stop_codon:yes gene_type:complete
MKDFQKILDILHNKSLINKKDASIIKSDYEFYNYLKSKNLSEDIILSILSEHFNYERLENDINEKIDIIKTNYGFIINKNYYIEPKYYFSNIIMKVLKKNDELNKKYFSNFKLISENEYRKIDYFYKKRSYNINSKKKINIKMKLQNLINDLINNNIQRASINTKQDFVYFNHETFEIKNYNYNFLNILNESIINALNELKEDDFYKQNLDYKINIEEISKSLIEITISNYYKKEKTLNKLQNVNDLKTNLEKDSGLVIFSQKYNYSYYYEILDYLISKNNKKVISFDRGLKENGASKNVNLYNSEEINAIDNKKIIIDFDAVFIEDINLVNNNLLNLINQFLSNGKKVVLFINSKDAINSIANIIYNYPELKKDILAEYINLVFHVTKLPKLCNNCKRKIKLIEVENVKEDFKDIYERVDGNIDIYLRNENGCYNCISGYDDSVALEQIIKNTNNFSKSISNFDIKRTKDELSSDPENNYIAIEKKVEVPLLKSKNISIYDIKTKI